jgi:DNA-binding CsgD family transcriptional regulator
MAIETTPHSATARTRSCTSLSCILCGDAVGVETFCSVDCHLVALEQREEVVDRMKCLLPRRPGDAPPGHREAIAVKRELVELTTAEANFACEILRERSGGCGQMAGHFDALTPKLLLVVLLAADGFHNTEIAWQVDGSPNTVRNYLSRAMDILGYRTRVDIAAAIAAARTRLRYAPETIPFVSEVT